MTNIPKINLDIQNNNILKDKNIIITGCSRGIGKSILQTFTEYGANVLACCRTKTDEFENFIYNLSLKNNVKITPFYFDITDSKKIKEIIKNIMLMKIPIDVLVNNAGITYNSLFQMTSEEKFREVFDVNFFSQIFFIQYIVKFMTRQKSGNIINIASTAAIDANPGRSAYGASKAALICVTRVMAHELANQNIRVNAISPGITETDMVIESMSNTIIQNTINQTRLKRIGKPKEIAMAALFLASELSSYITGQVIRVDGGLYY